MFKLGTARDFASVMLMYEEREGKRETGARKVGREGGGDAGVRGGEEGVMSLFYARILYLYILKSYQYAQMGETQRDVERRDTPTGRQTDKNGKIHRYSLFQSQ